MKRLKIGTLADIGIYLHWTFWLLIVAIFGFYVYQGHSLTAALVGVGLVLVLFVCVVLHEIGHALMARHYDVPTRDITIYPVGGVARLQRIPEEPMKEFWIALAGPAVNLFIAGVLAAYIAATGGTFEPQALVGPRGDGSFAATLMWLNALLFGFNLLPAFPMDGGRVLRALLASRLPYARATQIAANVGQGMAVLFGLIGVMTINPVLIFIGVFVYFGAQQESQQALMRSFTRGLPVRQAMLTRFATLSPEDTLNTAIDELLAGSDQDFPIVQGGHVVGLLTRKQMMKAIADEGREARIGDVIDSGCLTIEDTETLDEAFLRIQETDVTTLPVLRRGALVGLLTLENVGEMMMIHSALQKAGISATRNVIASGDRLKQPAA